MAVFSVIAWQPVTGQLWEDMLFDIADEQTSAGFVHRAARHYVRNQFIAIHQ